MRRVTILGFAGKLCVKRTSAFHFISEGSTGGLVPVALGIAPAAPEVAPAALPHEKIAKIDETD